MVRKLQWSFHHGTEKESDRIAEILYVNYFFVDLDMITSFIFFSFRLFKSLGIQSFQIIRH